MNPAEIAAAVAESISDPILLVDNRDTLAGINKPALSLLGFRKAGLVGKPLLDIVDSKADELAAKVARWRCCREPAPGTLILRTHEGARKIICEASAVALGEAVSEHLVMIRFRERSEATQGFTALEDRIQALAREIRERQKTEQALRISEERFRGLFENASDAIMVADDQGRIVEANPAACELIGRPMDEVAHLRVVDLGVPASRDQVEQLWEAFVESGVQRGYFTVVRPDGELREAEYSAVRNFVEGRHLSIMRDVTERQAMASERERHARALARSNAELERFAYVASHDLQEPLRTIASFVQLTERRLAPVLDSQAAEYMSVVKEGVYRLQRILLDMLEFSRLGTAERKLSRVNLQDVIASTLLSVHSAIEESGTRIEVGALPTLMGDPTQLYQLFLNLIGNAIKFRSGKPEIRVSANLVGEEWTICVRDNGVGIEAQYFARIFEPFRRLHGRNVPGSGIGLAICKRVVENHGGRIWVESQPGVGSTFYVALPAETAVAAQSSHS